MQAHTHSLSHSRWLKYVAHPREGSEGSRKGRIEDLETRLQDRKTKGQIETDHVGQTFEQFPGKQANFQIEDSTDRRFLWIEDSV